MVKFKLGGVERWDWRELVWGDWGGGTGDWGGGGGKPGWGDF